VYSETMTSPRRTRRSTRPADAPTRALAYLRVSTGMQVDSGLGLDAQRAAVLNRAEHEGWDVELIEGDEGVSAGSMNRREALAAALDRLDRGEAEYLLAANLSRVSRVSRSVRDFSELLERARHNGWHIVLLDVGDTSTPSGEMTANVVASMAQYERRIIGQRTRDALAARKARGERHGIASVLPTDLIARIVDEHHAGRSYRTIGADLETDGVLTAKGRTTWHASTVKMVLDSQNAATYRKTTAATAV